MIEIKAPNKVDFNNGAYTVFVAGSINMGNSKDWQSEFKELLSDLNIIILNPRRDDWDSTWIQSKDNSKFKEQVEWELECQEKADFIFMHFEPDDNLSPITLLELGLFGGSDFGNARLYVHCPNGYKRKGNVDIVCERYGIRQADSLEEAALLIKKAINIADQLKGVSRNA